MPNGKSTRIYFRTSLEFRAGNSLILARDEYSFRTSEVGLINHRALKNQF